MIRGGGISSRPMSAPRTTLIEHLVHHGETRSGDLCARYLFSDRAPVELTFGENLERTRRFAAGYEAHGVKRSDVVLVVLEHHEDLMPAFLGVTWVGAVPAFLPQSRIQAGRCGRQWSRG